MIDHSLLNKCESCIVDGEPLPVYVTENLLGAYTSLIEQNAELHKKLAAVKKVNHDMHVTVGGYLHGKEWEHWNEFNAGKFKL